MECLFYRGDEVFKANSFRKWYVMKCPKCGTNDRLSGPLAGMMYCDRCTMSFNVKELEDMRFVGCARFDYTKQATERQLWWAVFKCKLRLVLRCPMLLFGGKFMVHDRGYQDVSGITGDRFMWVDAYVKEMI